MTELNRRYFFFGLLAGASACQRAGRASRTGSENRVSIVRSSSYTAELVDPIRRILVEHQVSVADKRIVLKPNLVEFSETAPINTHPVFVAAAAEAFQSLGAASVRIAEGPGHRRMTLDMAEAAGFFSAVPKFESRFTDLNLDDIRQISIASPFSRMTELYLPHTVLDCDLLVSLAKMKTHHWAGATLSMKNLFGVVPGAVYGWPKNVLHWAGIHESITDLHFLFPNQFSLVDGIDCMEGNGPILGTRRHVGVIVGGSHPPSVDATCCRIMRINPEKIKYLQLVAERTGWSGEDVLQIGDSVGSVASEFALLPDFSGFRLS